MSSEESNKRRERETAESRRRTINYIVVAVLAALIVTVLFLVFGRSDKNSNNGQSPTGTTTEQVTTPSGTNGTATNPSGSVNRPPAKVFIAQLRRTASLPMKEGPTFPTPKKAKS